VFHWPFGKPPHDWIALDLNFNFIAGMGGPMFGWGKPWLRLMNLWQLRRANGPVAARRREVPDPDAMSREIKDLTREIGGDCIVGITRVMDDAIIEGEEVEHKFAICIGAPMKRELMVHAPKPIATTEVMRGYRRVARIAVELSERIRAMGWPAKAHGDPKTGAFVQIPHAIEAGLGQLGKHGSLISREYGSNFRLAAVTTDIPLSIDSPVDIGVDDLCFSCRRCVIDCPPRAIGNDKVLVRGVRKWYVDFDKCVPYFAENAGCAICIEVCPWSEPGRGFKLSEKLLTKRQGRLSDEHGRGAVSSLSSETIGAE
jgi:epoxyqueuosine reductase